MFIAGSMGMAVNNSRAIFEGLIGKKSPFVRTPKYSSTGASGASWWGTSYGNSSALSPEVFVEAALTIYSIAGLAAIVSVGQWAAIPFQLLFVLGFGLMTYYGIQHFRLVGSDA